MFPAGEEAAPDEDSKGRGETEPGAANPDKRILPHAAHFAPLVTVLCLDAGDEKGSKGDNS